jgi:hypothetical protein
MMLTVLACSFSVPTEYRYSGPTKLSITQCGSGRKAYFGNPRKAVETLGIADSSDAKQPRWYST